jgi:DivIVA domain-containing protein
MDLTPKLLTEGTDFQQVRRGYDPDEVDDFLERVAAAVSRLQAQLVEANRRAEMAEAASSAGPASPEGAVVEEMQRTLVLAQRTADAAVREAREEADSLVAAARREAATILTNGRQEADRYAAESRLALSGDVRDLEAQRDGLLAELEARREVLFAELGALDHHVEEQRARLRASIEELQRVVDDPDAFTVERPEGYEDVAPPTPVPLADVAPEPVAAAPAEPAVAPAEVEPVAVAEVAPVEIVNEVPAAEPAFASPPPPAPDPEHAHEPFSRPVPSAFGPPPGGSVQTMTSPTEVAAAEGEVQDAPQSGDSLIDLTHQRPMPDGHDEDAFLAELRKAMTDDEPLGPRDEPPGVVRTIGEVPLGRQRGRFGRRR